MRAVSNTSPLCYLILIDEIRILPELFTEIVIPMAVSRELAHLDAAAKVRDWIVSPPEWLSVMSVPAGGEDRELQRLDPGEREAIMLAEELGAELLLLDDWKAREVARDRELPMTGLIGVLDTAVRRGLVEPGPTVERLRATTFRVSESLLEILLRDQR